MHKILRYSLVMFYCVAGLNHFIMPDFYLGLIPDYLPNPELINSLSGVIEMLLGLLVIPKRTRRLACLGIVIMLVAFIPAHLHFIIIGSCVEEGLCVPPWIAWFRLVVIHPLLIWWAYVVGRN
ncbi:DoxX family membrane protein [Fulvivirga sp. RKSG066]|nr:DoxX family membrane protein [Fulvivirga aurantia]MTI20209.1 DoxX family membrane protein [Fulvivirga aurantia]